MRILVHDYGGYSFCLELSREIALRNHHVQHAFYPAFITSMRNMESSPGDPATLEIVSIGKDMPYTRYLSMFRRRAHEIAYGKQLARHIRAWKPDVVLCANTPLDVLARAFQATRAAGGKFVFWQQDVISTAMSVILKQRLGAIGSLIAAYYERMESRIARQSDAIICISSDFLPLLQRWKIPLSNCHVIENWAPKDDIRPMPKDNEWSRRHGLHDKKIFLYSGRLGLKHNPELLLRLARHYRHRDDVVILVVADGQGADWLAQKKQEEGLAQLRLMPFQDYSDLPQVLASGDVLVAIIEKTAHLYSVPSKILSYLAAGRAILAAMPRENTNARHILRIGAGLVVPSDEPGHMLEAAQSLMDNPELRQSAAQSARRHAEETFEITHIADRFMAILQNAVTR